jgi:hypothetical protein
MYPFAGREIFVRFLGNCDGIPAIQLDNNLQAILARHPFLDRRAGNTAHHDTQNRSDRAPLAAADCAASDPAYCAAGYRADGGFGAFNLHRTHTIHYAISDRLLLTRLAARISSAWHA